VAGVRVSAIEARHTATTDVNGFFSLELRDGTNPGADIRIHIQKAGYRADDLTEAASESVTYPIQIFRLGKPSTHGTYPQAQPPVQRTARFAVMIPFDMAPGAFPIPIDENPDDPLSRTYNEIHSLAANGTIPDSARETREMGQITWTSRSISMDESTTFLGRLLQYYILESIDSLQKDSLTVFVGYPAEANAGIEPPDAQPYPDDKLSQMLEDNRFFRPFLYRPNYGRLSKMKMPKDTIIEFREEGSPPQKCVVEFRRPDYFKIEFVVEAFAGTGPGSLPKHFVTVHPETVMQWPFFVTMRYSIEHHPEDSVFNPENYAKWLDALYDGLTKKMVLPESRGTLVDRVSSVSRAEDEHVLSAKTANNESAAAGNPKAESVGKLNEKREPAGPATASQNKENIELPQRANSLNSRSESPVRAETSNGILEEIRAVLEKDRESEEMRGCPTGQSVGLRMVGNDISYYVCIQKCFAVWKSVNPKDLEFGGVRVSQPSDDPELAIVEIPCSQTTLCTKNSQGTFPTSSGCLKKNVKVDLQQGFAMAVHPENVDAILKLWKEFARTGP
jgi:hypothetical protein